MAQEDSKFSLSKLNILSRLDARGRVVFLLGAVVGVIFLVYLLSKYLGGGASTTGPSHVANAPQGLQSVPGGQLSAEYQKALLEANKQAAQAAQMSGGSAIPTLINTGTPSTGTGNCNIICSDQNVNVKNDLEDWVKQGKISPEVASALEALADKDVSVDDYAAQLNQLVKEGKLTPEQARELLAAYKKQHANKLLQESANSMDAMIKSGQLPLDVANQLLTAQKNGTNPTDYAAQLQELVREGKITPEMAQQLLAQYTQQHAKEVVAQSIAFLHQIGREGQLIPEVQTSLIDMENKMVSVDEFSGKLQQFVGAGKLTPAVAAKVLDEFKMQKSEIGPSGSIDQLIKESEARAYAELADLLKTGQITQDVASELSGLIHDNVPEAQFNGAVSLLVQQKKLSPEIAKLKVADYKEVKGLRDTAQRLAGLQGNNANQAAYADELTKAVRAGLMTPDQAARLMQEYTAAITRAPVATAANGFQTEQYAQLQQRLAQGAPVTTPVGSAQFAAAQAQAMQESDQDRQARIQGLLGAMNNQAGQLVGAWQPPTMVYKEGSAEIGRGGRSGSQSESGAGGSKGGTSGSMSSTGAPIIKAGSILFAVLDTTANSDFPDSPVLATIVEGKYKGAKLLGKLVTTKSVGGQLDRISLNFTLMNKDDWDKSKTVTAYAIDPDTARTVMASNVNYHYLKKYGAVMATAFFQGYSTAITNAGTSTTGIFGTSTSHPALATSSKMLVGLGQIGTNLANVTQKWIDIPPTVRVEAGVGLGLLFMSDVNA